VAEGDAVKAGQLLFQDKKRPQIGFSSSKSRKSHCSTKSICFRSRILTCGRRARI
ncbi:MAG: hypothetical protein IJG80_02125, partial [Selenomonadaceae bacterium]|nr:hypothetical protein [Selenomonadaceae bacterium]